MGFTVIIPVFNGEDTLAQSLESVSAQLRAPDEVILVNDGSTDNSLTIAEQWKTSQAFRVDIITQQNQGLAAARNQGIIAASSDYLAFLDDDDIWTAEKLLRCEQYLLAEAAELLFHSAETFGAQRSAYREANPVKKPEDLLLGGSNIIPSCVVLKTEVARKFPFSTSAEFSLAEDLHLWLKLLQQNVRLENLPESLCLYRESGGISGDISAHLKCVFAVLNYYHHQGLISKKLLSKSIERKHYEAARYLHKRGDFGQARVHYQLADSSAKTQILELLDRLHIPL